MMADNPAPRRCVVLWNAEAYDARAHVNPDGVATFLNAHLGLERDTKCIVFAGNRSAAATKLAFWSLEVQGQEHGVIVHVDAAPDDDDDDLVGATALRLAERPNISYARVSATEYPALAASVVRDEYSLVFAKSEPAAVESLKQRGLDLSTMATHLQRVRPWTTSADVEPVWLANKRAVLVSDLYAYIRTVCRGVLVDLSAAEAQGIVFRGGSPPYEWVMVAATAFGRGGPTDAEAISGEEMRLFKELAKALRMFLIHALPYPHEMVLSRSGVSPFLQSRLVLRNYVNGATPTTSHVRYCVATFGKNVGLEWFACRDRNNGASIVRATPGPDDEPPPSPELLQAESPHVRADGARGPRVRAATCDAPQRPDPRGGPQARAPARRRHAAARRRPLRLALHGPRHGGAARRGSTVASRRPGRPGS